jgi:hypothetical protein
VNSLKVNSSFKLGSPTPWFIVAAIALVVALGFGVNTALFVSHSVVATGTVTALLEHNGDNGTTFAPQYTFTAQDGRTYDGLSNSSSNPPAYSVGQTIRVRYNPSHPGSNRIDSFGGLWGFPAIFALVAVAFAALAFAARAAKRRKAAAL